MPGDERNISRDHAQELRENRREIENQAELILSGAVGIKSGKDEPKEFRPDVPDHLKGALLRGLVKTEHRAYETKEECVARHAKLKTLFLLDKDAPIRWFNPETRVMEIVND